MKCFVCKKYMNPKRSGWQYITFYTKNGFLRRLTWCSDCGENRRAEVNKEYNRREKIDAEYMRVKYEAVEKRY